MLSVSFSGYCTPKLSVSITTYQLARFGLIAMETESLGVREPENDTDDFGHCSLDHAAVNWMMKFDGR